MFKNRKAQTSTQKQEEQTTRTANFDQSTIVKNVKSSSNTKRGVKTNLKKTASPPKEPSKPTPAAAPRWGLLQSSVLSEKQMKDTNRPDVGLLNSLLSTTFEQSSTLQVPQQSKPLVTPGHKISAVAIEEALHFDKFAKAEKAKWEEGMEELEIGEADKIEAMLQVETQRRSALLGSTAPTGVVPSVKPKAEKIQEAKLSRLSEGKKGPLDDVLSVLAADAGEDKLKALKRRFG